MDISIKAWDMDKKKFYDGEIVMINNKVFSLENGELGDASLIAKVSLGITDKNNQLIFKGDLCQLWIGGVKQEKLKKVEDLLELYSDMNSENRYYRITKIEVIDRDYKESDLLEVK